MSDTQQKFLDEEGLRYLWSRISMQDYPNNQTLVSVINAIDQTKADKTEVPKKPLIGDTINTTPTTVSSALFDGQPISIQHNDTNWGQVNFTAFAYSIALNSVVASTIFQPDSHQIFIPTLVGNLETDIWQFSVAVTTPANHIPVIDANLAVEGAAADARAVGDALTNIENTIDESVENALHEAKESGEFNGPPGQDGKSAYDLAQEGGYAGTEEEFINVLNTINQKAQVQIITWEEND